MTLTIPRLAVNARVQAAAGNGQPLAIGLTGEAVSILQQAFLDLGFSMPRSTDGGNSLPDGIFGTETNDVAKTFQRQNALTADGVVGPLTLKRLEDALIAESGRRREQATAGIRVSSPVG